MWQATAVAARIAASGGPPCRIDVIRTSGDRLQDAPLSEVGGKRLFVKEIEDALLRNEIDLAVHSSKDMPALLPDGLSIGAVLPREDPRDAVVLPSGRAATPGLEALIAVLGDAQAIGTGSVRRIAQLTRLLPTARFRPIRGNLDTRLRKLDAGDYDALILAAAGLHRLGHASRVSLALPVESCVPAPGQGIVAIEIRTGDEEVRRVVAPIDDEAAGASLTAERALVTALGGGCQTPIGALASPVEPAGSGKVDLLAVVIALDGSRVIRATARGRRDEASALGVRVAEQLKAQGADEILADAQTAWGAAGGIQP
jgi:hydroxymethylbilane synthase